jgi:hypothetical protein
LPGLRLEARVRDTKSAFARPLGARSRGKLKMKQKYILEAINLKQFDIKNQT